MLARQMLTAALFGFTVTAMLVALPYRLTIDGLCPQFVGATAIAKSGHAGGNGHGNGKGNSGGNGNSHNRGKSGNGGAAETGKKTDRQETAPATPASVEVNPATGDEIEVSGPNIRVLHPDGMKETIKGGRYQMTDAQGRTIVARRATGTDRARLRRMISR